MISRDSLKGLVTINDKDIWTEFGAFLTEEKRGGRDNLTAILAPAKAKEHVAVNIREKNGCKYSEELVPAAAERDVTLHFALVAPTRGEWLQASRFKVTFREPEPSF